MDIEPKGDGSMGVWRRTMSAGAVFGGAVALGLAVLLGGAHGGAAQTVGEGQIVSNCTFTAGEIQGLKEAIRRALGLANTNNIRTPVVMVLSFEENLGQPNNNPPNSPRTGVVLCRSSTEVASFQAVQETQNFPSSGTADLRELQQTSYVLIQSGARRSLRLCHTDRRNDCFVAAD